MAESEQLPEGYIPAYNIRTDLALEAQEVVQEKTAAEIPGVDAQTIQEEGITVSRVKVETQQAASRLGKAPGNYITIEAPGCAGRDSDLQDRVSEIFTRELLHILPLPDQLQQTYSSRSGQLECSPIAAPRIVSELLVTRHLLGSKNPVLGEGFRSVCAISPGVLGITGIETGEIISHWFPGSTPA